MLVGISGLTLLLASTALAADIFDWGWVGNSTSSSSPATVGFLNLFCTNSAGGCTTANNNRPNVQVDTTTGEVSGWGWFGESGPGGTGGSVGWVDFDPDPLPADSPYAYSATCLYPAPDPITGTCTDARIDAGGELYGWTRIYSIGLEGDRVLDRSGSNTDWGWVLLRGTIDDGTGREFGVYYTDDVELDGWAWSGGGTLPDGSYSQDVGLGWISLTLASPASFAPFVVTSGGDVYAGGDIIGTTDVSVLTPPYSNAMLLIEAGGSVSVFTTQAGSSGIITGATPIELPDGDNTYTSILGKLNVEALADQVDGIYNRFGHTVENPTAALSGDVILDNRVFVYDNNTVLGDGSDSLSITDPINFLNASGAIVEGGGTIIVDGDLNIQGNVHYDTSTPTELDNIASVAWIVLGNITVDTNVSKLSGAFFALGNSTGGGTFETVSPGAGFASRLDIEGLVMAKALSLQRTYVGTAGFAEPAENLIANPRLSLNPPPGLQDFAAVLPTLRPVAP